MQYKVPQNIDLEDKIVGPFTMIQFVYLLAGGSIVYIIITSFSINMFSILLSGPVGILTLALAFVKVQDRPFSKFLVSIVQYLTRPKRRIWKRTGLHPELIITNTIKKKTTYVARKKVSKSDLEALASKLDTSGNQPKLELLQQNEEKQTAQAKPAN